MAEQKIEPKRRGRHWLAPLNPLRENGHGKAWAEDAKSNIHYLRSRLDAVSSRAYTSTHHPACDHATGPDRQIDRMQVAVDARAQLDIAYAAATGMHPRYIPVVSAWNGACIEAAYKNIHYAEALIAHLYNEEDVRHAAPDALRRVKAALAPGVHQRSRARSARICRRLPDGWLDQGGSDGYRRPGRRPDRRRGRSARWMPVRVGVQCSTGARCS